MHYQRIIIKVGTSTLTGGSRALHYPRIVEFARQIKVLQERDTVIRCGFFRSHCCR
jgi:glutamate 5-kinase